MARPRVLLVEDDAMLRSFVRMALDELAIDLLECDSVAAAIQILHATPVQLVLTDLMLPGASGVDLLQQLRAAPELRGQAKVVVLSAGLTTAARQQLAPLGAWRLLEKPVSVGVLLQCVEDALVDAEPAAAAPLAAQPDEQATAVDTYFGGDTELFLLYRETCLTQFPYDISAGDSALDGGDLQALRRVAHSLKTVLLTLGTPLLSAQARDLEHICAGAQTDAAAQGWMQLRNALSTWLAQHP